MRRRRRANPSLTASLCLSMAAHALGLSALAWWYVRHAPPPRVAAADEAEIRRATIPPVVPPPRPLAKRPPPPPEPPPEPFDESQPFHDDSGEHGGHGEANRSTPGERPMSAERGPVEQADLERARVADPSLVDPAARRAAQAGQRTPADALPVAPTPAQHGAARPDFAARADAAADPAGQAAKPVGARGLGPLQPSTVLAPPAVVEDAPPPPSGSRDATLVSSPALTSPPPAREERGRQATPSDTESVPFAKDATVAFHDGRMEARDGLKVQVYNPRWGLASGDDLAAMGQLHAVFGVRVRPTGEVALVELITSSGSANVDEDCKRALYAGTFEARKDKLGQPVATLWTVVYD